MSRIPILWHLAWAGIHRMRVWFPAGWDRHGGMPSRNRR